MYFPWQTRLGSQQRAELAASETGRSGAKRRGKERRERLARKNVREEIVSESVEGYRGTDDFDSILSYIEGEFVQERSIMSWVEKEV